MKGDQKRELVEKAKKVAITKALVAHREARHIKNQQGTQIMQLKEMVSGLSNNMRTLMDSVEKDKSKSRQRKKAAAAGTGEEASPPEQQGRQQIPGSGEGRGNEKGLSEWISF